MDIVEFIKLCLIGLIQGITEPLPISSSAHMFLIDYLFQINVNNLYFSIVVNFASTIAIIIFFRKKIKYFFLNVIGKTNLNKQYYHLNRSFLMYLIIGSIPAGLIGFFFNDFIDLYFLNIKVIGFSLLLTSILLFVVYLMLKSKKVLCDDMTLGDSIIIGLLQAVALIPGISRSGSTIFGGISRNLSLERTLDFSFFLYIVASIGAFILSILKIGIINILNINYLIPFIISFVSTFFSIKWFYGKMNAKIILFFFIYCIILSSIILIFL